MIEFKQTTENPKDPEIVFKVDDTLTCDEIVEIFRLFLIACTFSPITVDESLNREE